MDQISREQLRQLAERKGQWCVTLYLPTHRARPDAQQDPIRLKNLLGQAQEQLQSRGVRGPDARSLLAPAQQWLEDQTFWVHQGDGLAIFAARDFFQFYRLPLPVEEFVLVNDRFHLKPILPMIDGDGRFFVLALSQKGVRVLEGSRWSIRELDVAQVPTSLAEALKYDDIEKQLQLHTHHQEQREGSGKGEGMFHGHGPGGEIHKNQLLRFFQKIDRGLHDLLHDKRSPLVLAGVDYYFPIYREANTYNFLVDGRIEGSPNGMNSKELHDRAWKVVEPVFRKKKQDALDAYHQALGTGRASNDLQDIFRALQQGRVGTLFVALNRHQWGKLDSQAGAVEPHKEQQPGDVDLLDQAALQTLLTSGTVYPLPPDQMPGGVQAAAVYRY
jgi:hypothetical protein